MSCMTSEKGLDLDAAIRILENIENYTTISEPPRKPKGGEIFIYFPLTIEEQENYKCDQYRWINSGPKEIPRKNPLVKKQYFVGKLPQGKTQAFQKHCYMLISDQRSPYPVLIHYMGDETVMVDYPHGNSKNGSYPYFAIAPSVRRDIANRSTNSLPTAIINSYRSSVGEVSENKEGGKNVNPVMTPRNKSQVRNIRRKRKQSNIKDEGVTKQDLATLHSIGRELIGFCYYLRTYPDLVCVVGLKELSVEVENLINITNNIIVFTFLESYKVGNYTITPFSFVHSVFNESPIIPLYFLISQNADVFTYEEYLRKILELLTCVNECQIAVITNQNCMFTSTLTVRFPTWLQVYDWELLFISARAFLRGLNNDIKVIGMRIKELKVLLNCDTFELYASKLERLLIDWPFQFSDYYNQMLREPIETRLGKWVLDRYHIFSPPIGVLRGVNSDLQLIMKQLQELKDVTLDIILPTLYHLQTYLYANLQKSFCNVGKFNLKHIYKFLKRDIDEITLPSKIYEPSNMVKIFRVRGISVFTDLIETRDDEENVLLQAQRIVEMGNVSHSTTLKAFLIKTPSGNLHGVQLFPRETCSCSLDHGCSHIMAARLALGMNIACDKKMDNKTLKMADCVMEETVTSSPESSKTIELPINTPVPIDSIPSAPTVTLSQFASSIDIVNTVNSIQETAQIDNATSKNIANKNHVSYTEAQQEMFNQPQQNVIQIKSQELQDVLNQTPGNEVFMVVSTDGGNNEKPFVAYQVPPDGMMTHGEQATQIANINNQCMNVSNAEIRIATRTIEQIGESSKANMTIELPPEQIVVTMATAE